MENKSLLLQAGAMVMKEFVVTLKQKTVWEEPFVACIGYFDGLHRGHQELINVTLKEAKKQNVKSAIISFDPDPWITLGISNEVHHITPYAARIALAEQLGIDYWITLQFTKEVADLSAEAFLSLLESFPLVTLVCGFDFTFGKGGVGTPEIMANTKLSFEQIVVSPIMDEDMKISTTLISQYIKEGRIAKANHLLGYPYQLIGIVVKGKMLGRTLGFPTANIAYADEYLLPKEGVYVGKVNYKGNKYLAMISIGKNPTVETRSDASVEVYILDFDEDIYSEELIVEFHDKIRDIIAFSSLDELVQQLHADCEYTRNYSYTYQ